MSRKLHHSISAAVAAAAFLVLGLVAAVPGVPTSRDIPQMALAAGSAVPALVAAPIATPNPSRAGKSARRQRHRLVMPYFSFSSRS